MSEWCAALQRNPERLEVWAERNLVKFNNGKFKVLLLSKNNHTHYRQGDNWLESSFPEKVQGALADKLVMSQQYILDKDGQQHALRRTFSVR